MEAKDLRIGNLIKHNGKVTKVVGLSDRCVHILTPPLQKYYHTVSEQDIEPIELTEEILLKCGFEKYGEYHDSYKNNPFIIELSILGESYCFRKMINANASILLKKMKYLHQLQNLYHSLTGKELIYNG